MAYKHLGVDLFVAGFLDRLKGVVYFGRKFLPLVRDLEAAGSLAELAAEPVTV
ncbi:hypothetical protein JK364_53145 [Streptomyces sp. 110]|uniref:Uncharacterized protein n=1 Tax=Streptomyces endocoffeicus TaxID=2898945 RepID=A0ABS1Q9A4_9ACTN|nr:hypothetical protein [Streptomyces endocoffeicus]MBL1120939.1 hypothetical protein [Streptomyces endocoffeicus]